MSIRFPENSADSPNLRPIPIRDGPGYALTQTKTSGRMRISIDEWTPEVERVMAEANVAHVVLYEGLTSVRDTMKGLTSYASQIFHLTLRDGLRIHREDTEYIAKFAKLEELSITGPIDAIDFSALTRLRVAYVTTKGALGSLAKAPALEWLALEAPVKDLTWLEPLGAIRSLNLNPARSLVSLDGVAASGLTELVIVSAPKLTSLTSVAGSRLEVFDLDGARSITDLSQIAAAEMLRVLKIEMGAPVASLDFVSAMPALRELRIGNTTIGGNEPCSLRPVARQGRLQRLALVGRTKPLRNLTDIERLGDLADLEVLMIDKGPKSIPSVRFVLRCQKLRSFSLYNMLIADGDLIPLLEHPSLEEVRLEAVGPNYSHTHEQFVAAMKSR